MIIKLAQNISSNDFEVEYETSSGPLKTRLVVLLTYCVDSDVSTKGIKMCESDSLRIMERVCQNRQYYAYPWKFMKFYAGL